MKRIKRIIPILVVGITLLLPAPDALAKAPEVSSTCAVLYEPQSGRFLVEKDADVRRPMASTTKLMTALVSAELLPLEREVVVPAAAVLVEGSSMGLRGGDHISVHDLLTGLLLSSGNDAANALAMLSCGTLPAFAQQMNRKGQELGLTNSLFVTPSGLDEGGHGSTARDMALVGAAVLKNPVLADICATKIATVRLGDPMREATLKNHNRLLWLYEPATGLKTGYTVKSGKCLVSAAQKDGVTLIVATLNGGDYWNDHISLYEYGFSRLTAITPSLPLLSECPVAGGTAAHVALTVEPVRPVTLLKKEASRIVCRTELPRFIWAPVDRGELVGVVRYLLDGKEVACTPIRAGETVSPRPQTAFFIRLAKRFGLLITKLIG